MIRIFSIFLILFFVITGCSKVPLDKNIITLRYALWSNDPQELQTTKTIIKGFNRIHPEIKIEIDNIAPSEYYGILLTRMGGGTPPDVFFIQPEKFPAFATKNVLLDLTDIAKNDPSFNPEIYYPVIYDAFKWNGRLYGLPRDLATLALFYNKDIFDSEKIPYPDQTWDWKKFLEVAKKITKDTDGDGRIDRYGYSLGFTEVFSWIFQNNGKIIENNRCTLDSPECIEAVQFLTDLRWKHKVASMPSDIADRGEYKLFMTGKVGMIIIGRWWVPTFRKIKTFDWDCAPLPKGKKRATALFGLGHAISVNTKYPKEAWEFLKYLSGVEGQRITAETGVAIPAVKSIAESNVFLNPSQKPANSKVFTDAISYAYPLPWGPKWKEIETEMQIQIEKALIGEKEVKTVMKELTRRVNKILEEENINKKK